MDKKAKFSFQTRAQLLIADEFGIDESGKKEFSRPEYLSGVLEQKIKLESQRDAVLKAAAFSVLVLVFLYSGADANVPGIELAVSEIPAIKSAFVFLASFSMLMYAITAASVLAYDAIVHECAKRRADPADEEVWLASVHARHLALKVFRTDFSFRFKSLIHPGWFARLNIGLSNFLIGAVFFCLFASAYVFIGYFAISQIGNDPIGIVVKFLSVGCLFAGMHLHWLSGAEFEHSIAGDDQKSDVISQGDD